MNKRPQGRTPEVTRVGARDVLFSDRDARDVLFS